MMLCCPHEDALDSCLPTECIAKTDQTARMSLRWVHMKSCRKCCIPVPIFIHSVTHNILMTLGRL